MFQYPLIILLSLSLLLGNSYAQKPVPTHSGGTRFLRQFDNAADPFGIRTVFIENKGQYGDTIPRYGYMGKILFGYEGWGLPVLFTSRGLIHLHQHGKDAAKVITMEWLGANTHPEIVEEDRAPGMHSYGKLTTGVGGFRRLTYKNMYPGIDVEYSFIPGTQSGFEYRIIVRPGADLSKVRMSYGGDATSVRDSLGSLVVNSGIGRITETAPVCYYSDGSLKEGKERIESRHVVTGKKRSFLFPDHYDHRRPMIIDPFVFSTMSGITGINAGKVMQVDFDNGGNVYVQGGYNEAGQIAKFDPAGNLLWTFASSIPAIGWNYGNNFGGWTVEKTTGNVYIGQGSTGFGCSIIRLNSNTGVYDHYHTPNFTDGIGEQGEIWKMRWYCNGGSPQILIAGGSGGVGSFRDNIGVLLLPSTNFVSYNITGITTYPYNQDVSDFVVDPVNNDLYSILASGNTPFVNNRIYKNAFPYIAANQQWNGLSGYAVLHEDNNTPFMALGTDINNPGDNTNATNILAITSKYLFYYDGKNLKALDKVTGATVGAPVSLAWTPLMQQGIFADECDNVYIGAANGTIKVFRFNGTVFDDNAVPDILIPGYSGKAVYALAYDQGHNLLYAGGDGFAGSFDLTSYCAPPPPPPSAYTLVITPATTSVTASITPTPPLSAVVTYTLLKGTTIVGSNATGVFTNLDLLTSYTMQADIVLGCTSAQAITNFKLKSLDLEVKGTDGCGTATASATATASGGSFPYTYSIDGINFQQSNVFPSLASGDYTIMVKDDAGDMVSRPITIVVSDLTVVAGNNVPICEGTFTRLSGSSNGSTVSWNPSAGLSSTAISNPKASPLTTTKYYFSSTKGSCTLTDSLIVQVLPAPVANAGKDTSICYASDAILRGSGGVCSWRPSTFLNNTAIAEPVVSHALYSVDYILQVTDGSGCHSIKDDTVRLRVVPLARVSAGSDKIISIHQPLQLNAIDLNLSGFNQYTWSPSSGLDNALSENPMAMVDNSISYKVTAVTPEGCTAMDTVKVTVYKGPDIYVPNAFTPNGDGHNDVLRVTAPGIKTLLFVVFNRWGQEVFRTTNPGMGWDGRLKGTPQDAGTFVWMLEAVDYTGKVIQRKGTVLLIR